MREIFLMFVATVCLVLLSSAAVAAKCSSDQRALALNMYYEARGDGETVDDIRQSMLMVAEVTLNRVESDKFPDTICQVIYQKSQFSWTSRNVGDPKEQDQWLLANGIAMGVLSGAIELPGTSAEYFTIDTKYRPKWTKRMKVVARVGSHVFYVDRS